jgi:acetyl-CoA C-acetyltransferase
VSALAITGVGQTTYRRRHVEQSSGDLLRLAASAAAADAGLELREIDAFVLGVAPDALCGVNCPEKSSFFLPARRPVMRVNTGGTTGGAAFALAATIVAAGQAEHALAIGLERMGQATTSQKVFNTIFDPIYEKDIALSTLTMASMRASMLMQRYGYTAEHWAAVAARNYRNAVANPYAQVRRAITVEEIRASKLLAWPIHLYEACPMSEGACAVVVSRRPPADGVAWVRGLGSFSDTYAMGDRMRRPEGALVDLLTLRRAAERAYAEAGVSDPADRFRVVELHAPFSSAEAMAYPALGLCTAQGGPAFAETTLPADARVRVNPSGGPQAANPVSTAALVRIAECANQVRGRAGPLQVPDADWAVATCQGGASQFSMACVLSTHAG